MRLSLFKQLSILLAMLGAAAIVAACANPVRPAPPRPTAIAATGTNLVAANIDNGMQQFSAQQCVACHGPLAQGGIGPRLANTALSYDAFLSKVRNAIPPKPAYSADVLPDQDVYDIYTWLQTLSPQVAAQPRPALEIVKIEPGQEDLPAGPILGMSLWTGFKCDTCHGAFAQGSSDGPELAGISYPYELERAKMRQTANEIPEHDQTYMRDTVLKRLYQWLQSGANPEGGC